MAELKDLMDFQRKFDEAHGWNWGKARGKELLDQIKYGTIAITGEIGEFANIVKKITRQFDAGKTFDQNLMGKLKEELTDIFIYLMIIANTMGIDLEAEYFKKMEKNMERFKEYRK